METFIMIHVSGRSQFYGFFLFMGKNILGPYGVLAAVPRVATLPFSQAGFLSLKYTHAAGLSDVFRNPYPVRIY